MLKDEILPFVDSNGLVAPNNLGPSDNGVMFTAEFLWLCALNNESIEYSQAIDKCLRQPGLLNRRPRLTDDHDVPDNYYGFAAYCALLKLKQIPNTYAQQVLEWGYSHFGCFNNVNPGVWTAESFLWRQPQLYAAFVAAGGDVPFYLRPFLWFAALVILVSCRGVPIGDTDSRRIPWLLIQTVAPESWLCRMAAKGWYARLFRDYGDDGMKAVARIYYQEGHPFAKYHEDKVTYNKRGW